MPTELIVEVSGDNDAGFYQPRVVLADSEFLPERDGEPVTDDAGPVDEQAAPAPKWKRSLQAYSWGGLTSGPASRALWLLFLPFILVNLAHWMLPPVVESRRRSASAAVALLRLIGLTLTMTLMLAGALAAMDIIGWQCAAMEHCGSHLGLGVVHDRLASRVPRGAVCPARSGCRPGAVAPRPRTTPGH